MMIMIIIANNNNNGKIQNRRMQKREKTCCLLEVTMDISCKNAEETFDELMLRHFTIIYDSYT